LTKFAKAISLFH